MIPPPSPADLAHDAERDYAALVGIGEPARLALVWMRRYAAESRERQRLEGLMEAHIMIQAITGIQRTECQLHMLPDLHQMVLDELGSRTGRIDAAATTLQGEITAANDLGQYALAGRLEAILALLGGHP